MRRLPPALASSVTPRILELLDEPPGRVLEIGFAGIHAQPLELAGWEVIVLETEPAQAERARQRGAHVVGRPEGRFDAVIAPAGADLEGVEAERIVLVDERGVASMSR
jgi:hypothetical protein